MRKNVCVSRSKPRSARERRALLALARTWSSLAAQTEAYEAIVCKLVEPAPADEEKSFKPKAQQAVANPGGLVFPAVDN
jgi:hypothetical protein